MLNRMKFLFLIVTISMAATTAFADADLVVTPVITGDNTFPAGATLVFSFSVRNDGPDQATDVVISITTTGGVLTGPCVAGCPHGALAAGQGTVVETTLRLPDTGGDVVLTATATSSTADPNPGNNSASMTDHVSPYPAIGVRLRAPPNADLGIPFTLTITLFKGYAIGAHDVDTTVAFRPDVTVKTLPSGCTNPAAGSVVCHADVVDGLVEFAVILIAPPTYGDGQVSFDATTTEREPNFYPAWNRFQAKTVLYDSVYVTTTADSGAGSLRQTILDANAATGRVLTIAFRIAEESSTPWKTIRVESPLPPITALGVRIDGGTQTGFFGDANPDGPEIEISGGGTVDGDGLFLATCNSEVANLAISGFLRNGISVTTPQNRDCPSFYTTELHHLFIGCDPTGSSARRNARGIGTSVVNNAVTIHDCVISGNTFSGIFDLSGLLGITNNRIGAKAHADEPLPNGASGIYIGAGGYRSNVGPASNLYTDFRNPTSGTNVIAFNGETGVAVAADARDVVIQNNRIWSNRLLGIDIGLNGPTASVPAGFGDTVTSPVLTIARYDPAQNKTIVEGDLPDATTPGHNADFSELAFLANIYASDAADPSGYGEGQRSLGSAAADAAGHFHFEAEGDLTGQWITATNTRFRPADLEAESFFTQTSEFSRGVTVQ
jgi:Domain of unknown function DUF11/Right handed beta helix region